MAFDLVIGHEHARARLLDALASERLAHAYLFHGPQGTGGEALAIELAKAVNCENGAGEPCQHCRSCYAMATLRHPDVRVYLPASNLRAARGQTKSDEESEGTDDSGKKDPRAERRMNLISGLAANPYALVPYGKGDFLSVDDIRELRRDAGVKPYQGRRKVVLIFGADRMNVAASNALLKTLEEPPGGLLLILTTDRISRLLPTIISRCQPVHLSRLDNDTLKWALCERFNESEERAALGVALADGSVGEALQSLSDDGQNRRDSAFALIETVHGGSLLELFDQIDLVVAANKEKPIVDALIGYYRDLLLTIEMSDQSVIQSVDRNKWIKQVAAGLSFEQVQTAIDAIEEMRRALAQNAYIQLALTVLALRLKVAAGTA